MDLVPFPLIVSRSFPGPWIVSPALSVMSGRGVTSVMVPVTAPLNVMVSAPAWFSASVMAFRSDPEPESCLFVTV